jgi:hypothetical protein
MLSHIGFKVGPLQKANFSDVIIKNFRHPSNALFSAQENPTLFTNSQIAWNGIQNTPVDIAKLTNKILTEYRHLYGN